MEDGRSYQVQPVSLGTGVHTAVSLAQCFCHPEVLRLSVLAQQQIFFLLVDKDLINPEHQYFIDEAHPSKVPPKAADISLILILVHASSSLSS